MLAKVMDVNNLKSPLVQAMAWGVGIKPMPELLLTEIISTIRRQ